jgi:hypothetical protein
MPQGAPFLEDDRRNAVSGEIKQTCEDPEEAIGPLVEQWIVS